MEKRVLGICLIFILLVTAGLVYYYFSELRGKLVVATTTSLYDTGLLDVMEEKFEEKYPVDVSFISAGTGIAIKYAQDGEADMIMVHAPSKELSFLEDGYGVSRKIIAYNFFSIVGPAEDPAGVNGSSLYEALVGIVEAGRRGEATWVSREDESGTHIKEKGLWTATGFTWEKLKEEVWYLECGCGMGTALRIADERNAYTLSDMGTYLKYHTDELINLVVIVEKSSELLNVYSGIAVNRAYNPEANFEGAITFMKFLISEECQQIIDEYEKETYSSKLFYPAVRLLRDNTDPVLVSWIRDTTFFYDRECPEEYWGGHGELYD